MTFCRWYPLSEAPSRAPRGPGVYQLRISHGLVDYPSGKSAMIHYGVADDVRAALEALDRAHAGEPWLARHAEQATAAEARALAARLTEQFLRRFGAPPTFPGSLP
jgi:hypothetical protein